MKLIALLQIDSWVDRPQLLPAYIFNNIKDLVDYFNKLGTVEVVKEPDLNDPYHFGQVVLSNLIISGHRDDVRFCFTTMYAKEEHNA